jgi:hypothetical protein
MELVLKLPENMLVYKKILQIHKYGSVIIFNFLKYGMQLVVLEILAVNLSALVCNLKTFMRCVEFPQNKIPYFNS